MRVIDFIREGRERLRRAGVYNPEANIDRIIDLVCGYRPAGKVELDHSAILRLEEIVQRREHREPLARIIGQTISAGVSIKLASNVFQPYPETESVVEQALLAFRGRKPPARILDLGCGSGCILLALLKAFPKATGLGIDCSEAAVSLASANALYCGVDTRATFRLGDWTAGLDERSALIVSNPPRVPSSDVPKLLPEMRDHDPRIAYDGGRDGLTYFRRLAEDFHWIADANAIGVFQVSDAKAVVSLFRAAGYADPRLGANYLGLMNTVIVAGSSTVDTRFSVCPKSY